jgi:hypothetical protein
MEKINTLSMLINIPVEDINYELIDEFIKAEYEEHFDLDYKVDFPSDLEKLLCAFANTQGGIIVLGIKEQEKNRKPIYPPLGMQGDKDSIRQRILNIAFDAIYPPIEPEVVIVNIPGSDRYVIIIRILQSSLLHAVDRRSRIYIRSQDNNRGYSLAAINELQWLFDRRKKSLDLKHKIIESSIEHSLSSSIKNENGFLITDWQQAGHLIVIASPVYPEMPLFNDSKSTLDTINSIGKITSNWKYVDRKIPWEEFHFRTFSQGVCLMNRGQHFKAQFIEIGNYGNVYIDFLIENLVTNPALIPCELGIKYVEAYIILSSLDLAFQYINSIYESINFRKPLSLTVSLSNVKESLLHYDSSTQANPLATPKFSKPCLDNSFILLEIETNLFGLSNNRNDLMLAISKSLVWSFGIGWEEKSVAEWLSKFSGVDYPHK